MSNNEEVSRKGGREEGVGKKEGRKEGRGGNVTNIEQNDLLGLLHGGKLSLIFDDISHAAAKEKYRGEGGNSGQWIYPDWSISIIWIFSVRTFIFGSASSLG